MSQVEIIPRKIPCAMDESLVTNWNQVVTNGDTVYIIGDLMFRTQNQPMDVLKRLKGKKHLILGNHNKDWLNKTEATDFFQSVESYTEISDGKPLIHGKTSSVIWFRISNKNCTMPGLRIRFISAKGFNTVKSCWPGLVSPIN